mmetsp:Transcript_47713/g.110583  ORF Transcript_47713/g.110583 Transcript_47713/m.110583 type:complete len:263 (+) Transcript_47713:504-1292(+)
MSGCQKLMSRTTRSSQPRCQTSCSHESSKTRHFPSSHWRVSSPTRMKQPSGTSTPRWQVSRALVEPQCARRCVPGLSTEKSVSPPPAIASASASSLRSMMAVVSGHCEHTASCFLPLPKSGASLHSPAATRVWSCTARPPTLPKGAALTCSCRNSVRMRLALASRRATSGKCAGACQGIERSPRRRCGGRCIECCQMPAATPREARWSSRRREPGWSSRICPRTCTPLTNAPWCCWLRLSASSKAVAAPASCCSCISTKPSW